MNGAMLFFGLIKRKERWGLTLRGWLILLFGIAAAFVLAVATVHPFLAVNEPVRGDALVVEGWLADYAVENALKEFRSRDYRFLVVTGGPLATGHHLSEYKTCADLTAATLKKLGLSEDLIKVIPAPFVKRNATYTSAIALKKWLSDTGVKCDSLDIYSQGVHARRTRMLFQKALGDKIEVGVIAGDDRGYDPHRWWASNTGARSVVYETIAYIYTRFFFYPDE